MVGDPYPEHLNPFSEDVKRKSPIKIGNRFKEFTNTIRRSFRGKSRTEELLHSSPNKGVALRSPNVNGYDKKCQNGSTSRNDYQQHRVTLPAYVLQKTSETSPCLPRSRFEQRVKPIDSTPTKSHKSELNPFNSDETIIHATSPMDNVPTIQNVVVPVRRRRRKKNAAPLPPLRSSISSQNVSTNRLDDRVGSHSKWSLNTIEGDDDIHSDEITLQNTTENSTILSESTTVMDDEVILEELSTFNLNMSMLNSETESVNGSLKETTSIPDVTIQCVNVPDSLLASDDHVEKEEKTIEIEEDTTDLAIKTCPETKQEQEELKLSGADNNGIAIVSMSDCATVANESNEDSILYIDKSDDHTIIKEEVTNCEDIIKSKVFTKQCTIYISEKIDDVKTVEEAESNTLPMEENTSTTSTTTNTSTEIETKILGTSTTNK